MKNSYEKIPILESNTKMTENMKEMIAIDIIYVCKDSSVVKDKL